MPEPRAKKSVHGTREVQTEVVEGQNVGWAAQTVDLALLIAEAASRLQIVEWPLQIAVLALLMVEHAALWQSLDSISSRQKSRGPAAICRRPMPCTGRF